MDFSKINTGSSDFDELIGGGLERRVITQMYGEPGSGKSTICTLCAVNILKSGKCAIIIDSEGFSAERFEQIAGSDESKNLAERLFLFEPLDFSEQGLMIAQCDTLLRDNDIGLIILDSATALYRVELGNSGEGQRRLGQQLIHLLGYARKYDIPVIVTNQVYMDINNEMLTGLGGTSLRHISKVIVRLEKQNSHKTAILEKHRSKPEGRSFDFKIINEGIIKV
ncbi:DNA repair and recombination protein RadB [Methanoplanus sp. FWC-SCC4]|uniref:DNA repair and recombination protein RadB n=1 Tax=Methanochimaera problematica TaxID=2609417 RepID=A0AA97I3B7_9EURY|nr:DNA repair and recombination protein RadB [Methanoplanus sp. FWC-SCC4]WOF15716.1 DNA repair and recombination protein RadB [Methanoplanus sp. FWC-SCC4]